MNEPHRWASEVFRTFSKTYVENLGRNCIWTLSAADVSRKSGLTRQQTAAGLQLLKGKGLIRLMTRWQFRLTSRGEEVCAASTCETCADDARYARPGPHVSVTIKADTISNAQIGDGNVSLKVCR